MNSLGSISNGALFELKRTFGAANSALRIGQSEIPELLLSMETVQLAKIDNLIRAELLRRAEHALKFGTSAPRKRFRETSPGIAPCLGTH